MTPWAQTLFRAIGLARIARIIPNVPDPSPSPVKGALLELMLPGLHLLNVVSVLDDALSDYVEVNNIPWPANTNRNLFHRIDVVARTVPGIRSEHLHQIRELRNSVAHASETSPGQALTWAALDEALVEVAGAFIAMKLIDRVPQIVGFYERHPTLFVDDLGPEGERMRHRHRVGAKVDDRCSWSIRMKLLTFHLTLANYAITTHIRRHEDN